MYNLIFSVIGGATLGCCLGAGAYDIVCVAFDLKQRRLLPVAVVSSCIGVLAAARTAC